MHILMGAAYSLYRVIIAYHNALKNHEAGVNHILADIRTRFWIVHGREAVRSWELQCNSVRNTKLNLQDKSWHHFPNVDLILR